MKAARFYGGKDIRVETVPDPAPGPGQVLIRVRSGGICGSDLHGYRKPSEDKTVRTLCHELSGEVVTLGPKVTGLRVGQRVGVEPLIVCGHCGHCQSGKFYLCPELGHIGYAYSGGFAEYTVAPQEKCFPLPDDMSFDVAALIDVYGCAVHAQTRVPVSPGDRVAVIGTGAIGLTFAELAQVAGADVAVLGRRSAPLKVAAQMADAFGINVKKVDPVKAVIEWSGGRGADVTFECVGGTQQILDLALQITAKAGTVGLEGVYQVPQTIHAKQFLSKELSLVATNSYARRGYHSEYQIALDLLAAGKLNAEPLITHHFPLDQVAEAFEAADNKAESGAIRVMVIP